MNCPKCKVEMSAHTVVGIEVDKCPDCEGIYFDQGELDQLLTQGAPEGTDNPEYSAISDQKDMELGTCPRCDQEMEPYLGPRNLRLDRCNDCNAVFLDQGELSELLSTQG
ncbi:MAG: zf-TFIIB domain-containing protein [bacterium]